jgi:uncharacterized protein YndB with AHSA1/START domain
MSRQITESTVVAAPPEAIFDLLADPSRHAEIDGSGTVQGPTSTQPRRLELGSRFGMRMRIKLPYVIRNEVVDFEENRRIAWRHWYRHVWRWELEPTATGTRVTETFDYAPSLAPWVLERAGLVRKNEVAIGRTLQNLQRRFEETT